MGVQIQCNTSASHTMYSPLSLAYLGHIGCALLCWLLWFMDPVGRAVLHPDVATITLCLLAGRVMKVPATAPLQHLVASCFALYHFLLVIVSVGGGLWLRCLINCGHWPCSSTLPARWRRSQAHPRTGIRHHLQFMRHILIENTAWDSTIPLNFWMTIAAAHELDHRLHADWALTHSS